MTVQTVPKAALYESAAFLDPFLLESEPERISTKWEPYRHLKPSQCNREFVKAYQEAFKDHVRAHVDLHLARNVTGVSLEKFTGHGLRSDKKDKNGEVRAVHVARLEADDTGLPYYAYIRFCMEFASNRSVRNIPRPNQLAVKPKDATAEKDPKKRDQQARTWEAFGHALRKEIDETLPRRRAGYKSNNPDFEPSPIPGCLGIPAARYGANLKEPRTSEVCARCPYAEKCASVAAIIERKIEKGQREGEATWEVRYQCGVAKERDRARKGMSESRKRREEKKLSPQLLEGI